MADPKKSYNDIITWAKGTSNDIIAKQLATARTISITNNSGTALASGTFNGTGNLTLKLPATVGIDISGNAATATKLGTANKGSATQPIYLNAGVPTAVGSSLAVSVTGNAATATKLKTARNIALTGAVTGNGNFDGSGNLSIATILGGSNLLTRKTFSSSTASEKFSFQLMTNWYDYTYVDSNGVRGRNNTNYYDITGQSGVGDYYSTYFYYNDYFGVLRFTTLISNYLVSTKASSYRIAVDLPTWFNTWTGGVDHLIVLGHSSNSSLLGYISPGPNCTLNGSSYSSPHPFTEIYPDNGGFFNWDRSGPANGTPAGCLYFNLSYGDDFASSNTYLKRYTNVYLHINEVYIYMAKLV